jgi:hypothetical protein
MCVYESNFDENPTCVQFKYLIPTTTTAIINGCGTPFCAPLLKVKEGQGAFMTITTTIIVTTRPLLHASACGYMNANGSSHDNGVPNYVTHYPFFIVFGTPFE